MDNSVKSLPTTELILFNRTNSLLKLQVVNLDLVKQESTLSECRLTFQIDSQLYQQIDTELLFNLRRELRGSLNAVKFQTDTDIKIEVALQSQLLPQLAEHTTDPETALAYFIACYQQSSDASLEDSNNGSETNSDTSTQPHPCSNPLLSTESWFALGVTQYLESGEIGYRTFWSYVNPAVLTPEAIANGRFSEAMEQFLKDRNEADLSMVGKAISEVFEEMTNGFKGWDETEFLKQTEAAISEIFAEVNKALESLTDPSPASNASNSISRRQIYQAMLNFFSEDDWAFAKIKGEPTLRLAFKGKNGQWDCYAKAIDEREQFVFYSVCPVQVPNPKRETLSEFIARANYDMIIGNFELNFADGGIRYKTSIDVKGERLTSTLIKQLVYANVMMMDSYLAGIKLVIESDVLPVDAIAQIESQPE
jgi:hypothetical protein